MDVPKTKISVLSPSRLRQARVEARISYAEMATRVREFDKRHLGGTDAKQLTRWEQGQRPRYPEYVVAAYAQITRKRESFFYAVDDDDEEEPSAAMRKVISELLLRGQDDMAAALMAQLPTQERVA